MTDPNTELGTAVPSSEEVLSELPDPDEKAETSGDETEQQDGTPSREAAKYRRERNDARTERDQLAERLSTMQRAEAERLAADKLGDGSDLWSASIELASLLDEDGHLSAKLVDQAVTSVLDSKPHWKKRGPAAPPASTVTANGKIGGDARNTFADAFRPRSG